ncbi:hypothetical protein E4U24_006380 [Claviceps purpurea]|nr:hypothetical protein E4U12_008291 [Claviceps purpurea]KAG6154254.1 hypothetical protein E4U37_002270 [Claviceps purpurea]KAG6156106.1 hypothetical protein E4U11_005760 [Claviceps purpurea]KAG6183333.1 hypothetical protein E4U36_002767 [Claviceps purpurea]KAG6198554.1 hypothetical protein E4U10_006667 [Claviceps purpurea]
MRFSTLAVAAFAGIAVAKRGCRRDPNHHGKGWYWIVLGDELDSIAADFGQTADEIARDNGIKDKNFIPAHKTIYVNCPW